MPQSSIEADRWLRTAADSDDYPEAQLYLAARLIREEKLADAWGYLRLAAEEGKDSSAQEELNRLRPQIAEVQVARGEEHFRRLRKRHSWRAACGAYDLQTPVQPPSRPSGFSRPRLHRPLRIVALDDEPCVVDALQMMLRFDFPDSFIFTFTSAESALQELEREDPDLFTTDINHVGLKLPEILNRLAGHRRKYPVFVISAYAETDYAKQMVRQCVDQGWDITLLSKPFSLDDLRKLLSSHLGLEYSPVGI